MEGEGMEVGGGGVGVGGGGGGVTENVDGVFPR